MSEPIDTSIPEEHETIDVTEEANPAVVDVGVSTNELPPTIHQKVTLSESITVDRPWNPDELVMSMPSVTNTELQARLGQLPNVDLLSDNKSRTWGETLRDGQDLVTYGDVFDDAMKRDGADFRQFVELGGNKLQAGAPRIKSTENERIRGERAILRATRELGLGTTFQVPCWHSGIWVTFKPPTEIELLELNRAMIASKIRLGYNTYGLAFSNITSYTVDHLADFMRTHIYATTVKNEELTFDKLMAYIDVRDLYTLIWGLSCTIYPKGFQIRRACTTNPEKCNHVTEEVINLGKLQHIDISQLNEWQKAHMGIRRPFERDLDSVKKYKDEMLVLRNSRVRISKDGHPTEVYVNFKSPSIEQYLIEGNAWISGIVDKVNSALKDTDSDADRNLMVQRYGQASSMRQYSHWVDTIELGSNTIDDSETIRSILDVMSSDDFLREEFLSKVVDYINQSTISVIGIPGYECPNCKGIQTDEGMPAHFTNVVAIDCIQYFFSLATQRIQRIATR